MTTDDFSHLTPQGNVQMVDISHKGLQMRQASAQASLLVNQHCFHALQKKTLKKGDALTTARLAGIMAAKKTAEIIPLCHSISLDYIAIDIAFDPLPLDHQEYRDWRRIVITATAKCRAATGVEMEALTAANITALSLYDMCKAVQKDMVISDIKLLKKEKETNN